MPRYTKHSFQVGEWWLSQRSGSPAWYATCYDAATQRTRRVSLGTDDFEQARQRLLERYLEQHRPQNAPAESVALADILLDYYKTQGSQARSAGSVRTSCGYWVDFFGEASVAEATKPPRLEAFIAHLTGQGSRRPISSASLASARPRCNAPGGGARSRPCPSSPASRSITASRWAGR